MNPRDLKDHPILSMMPRIPEALPESQAFMDDIRANGIRVPLLVSADGRLIDGRRRRDAAIALGMEHVPVFEDGEPVMVLLSSLTQRRHLTKGELAYVAYPLLVPAVEVARERRMRNLKNADSSKVHSVDDRELTAEGMAKKLGFGRSLFFQAQHLHTVIADDASLRPLIEEQVFVVKNGLGAIIAGLAGRRATKGEPRGEQIFFDFTRVTNAASTFAQRWSKTELYEDAYLERTRETLTECLGAMPDEALEELGRAVNKLRKAKA